MQHFDSARLSPNSVRNAVRHALNEPVCQYLRKRNPRCSTVYIDNSLGPLARDSTVYRKVVSNGHLLLVLASFIFYPEDVCTTFLRSFGNGKKANLIHRYEIILMIFPVSAHSHSAYTVQCSLKRRGYSELESLEPVHCPLE